MSRLLAILAVVAITACQAQIPEASVGSTPPASPLSLASAAIASASPTIGASSSPSTEASPTPTAHPTAKPTARPTPAPRPSTDLAVDDLVMVITEDLRVRAAPGLDGSPVGTAPRDELFLVAAGPVVADGYAWFFVMPFDSGPVGWVAASGRDGEAWLGLRSLRCPATPLDGEDVLELGAFGGLACFGANEIRLIGNVRCVLGDGDLPFTGPYWLSATGTCTFDLGGQTLRVLDGGIGGLPLPMTGRVSLAGHFNDPEASTCRWALGPPAPDPIAVVTSCRALFVATSMDPP
jgi:hypothetical protein